jgi:hypothetical protein
MKLRILGAAVFATLFLPPVLYAQDATIIGTVKDATDAVLPGVTVTALNLENGNTAVAVTDEAGNYRLSVRPGLYTVTAELPGFSADKRERLELQVGARATLDLRLRLAGVAETITVTGEAPLVDTSSSRVAAVIDRRQVEDLPVNGRNFVDLTMLAPGSRANAVTESATPRNSSGGESQLNVDGQQVTQMTCCQDSFGNPRYSKDSIAEFEVITTRFDASQGHSGGAMVNAITKSGTNRFAGSLSGYFRHDRFNAKDFVAKRVLPYQDQQVSTTFGGPIRKDRLHFFFNYEYEREPQTKIFTTPFPLFNREDLLSEIWLYTTGLRFDYQVNPRTRVMAKGYRYYRDLPVFQAGGADRTISNANASEKNSDSLFGTLTQTFGSNLVNELKGGYNSYFSGTWAYVEKDRFKADWNHPGAPSIQLNGLWLGGPSNLPQRWWDTSYQLRDDLTMLFSKRGRHELKIGGEFLQTSINLIWMQQVRGTLTAIGGPIPANVEQLFPDQYNWHTWNLAALSPISLFWTQSVGDFFVHGPSEIYSAWAQDNYSVTPQLTLNLGVRYEFAHNQLNEDAVIDPFMPPGREAAKLDFMPRLGAAYNINDGRTVFRGGWGKYFAQNDKRPQWGTDISVTTRVPSAPNDGRADFASNPYNGRQPTFQEVVAGYVADSTVWFNDPNVKLGYSWQSSIGVSHQLNDTMSAEADYVWQGGRRELNGRNMNLTFDENGVNYPWTIASRRPFPNWGRVQLMYSDRNSDYHGMQTAFNKRLSNNWQANATYSLAWSYDDDPFFFEGFGRRVTNSPNYIGGERSLAVTDQRHRATVSGIWSLPYGLQLSGLYFFGSGARFATIYGGDRTQIGAGFLSRLGPGGVVAPRNNFVGRPLHRVDMRFMKRVGLGGPRQLDGILELFNVFNHANYGNYTTNLGVPANYGKPQQFFTVTPAAYLPRMMQLGFRFAF